MIGVFICAAALLLGGAVLGVLAVVALAIRREDRELTLTGAAADRAALGTRRLTGASSRSPGVIEEVRQFRNGSPAAVTPAREAVAVMSAGDPARR
jgi:hypothetical protein